MGDFLKETVVRPMATRLGTFAGAYLLSYGVNQHDTNTIVAGAIAAILVGVDLIAAYRANRKAVR